MQSVNGARFLTITCLLFLSPAITAASVSYPTTAIVPYKSMDASL